MDPDVTISPCIRLARIEDVDTVAGLASSAKRSDFHAPTSFSAEVMLRDGFGPKPAFQTHVAVMEGEVCGYAIHYQGYDVHSASRGIYLADLFVAPDFRRRGVGRALITSVARYARNEGGDWIFWAALKKNRVALRFYRTLAPELKDVVVFAAFRSSFDRIASAEEPPLIRKPLNGHLLSRISAVRKGGSETGSELAGRVSVRQTWRQRWREDVDRRQG